MNSQDLLDVLTADTASHISFLQSFVRAPSPNPPGDTRQAAAVIQSYLASHGIATQVIAPREHMPNIVADFACGCGDGDGDGDGDDVKGGGPRLVMNGHIDVFPAGDGHDWERSPWSGDVADGRLHGRGTVDMKAGTAASAVAFAYLFRHREHLRRPGASLALCAVSDEETGGRYGTRWLLDHDREGRRELAAGERSPWAGDVVLDAEPGGPGSIRFAEKGTLRLTFAVDVGPGAHGAYTHLSRSATRVAAALIGDLAAVEDMVPDMDPELRAYLEREDVRRAIDDCMGKGAADIAMKCTLNIGTIRGGLKVNMIPGTCAFEADIRTPPGLAAEDVMAVVRGAVARHPGAAVEVQRAASNPAAAPSARDHPVVGVLARQAARVAADGRPPPLAIPSLGATDCKFYRYRGIPAYVFGVSPGTMGGRDESVPVDEFLAVLKTHALAAWEYLGGAM